MNAFRYLHVVFLFMTVTLLVIFSRCDEETIQPPPPPPPEPDTTSHDFTWTTYYLGDGQSYLQDVFAVNDSDVWAVGEIYLKDSTGQIDPNAYNAAHWDGKEWKLHALSAITYFGEVTRGLQLTSVFGFSRDDIWMFSIVGAYVHWDGREWTTKYVPERSGTVSKIWGRSSSDLYFVGTNGSIMHYNGRTFLPMESGTNLKLTDIYGNDTETWAVSGKPNIHEGIVLTLKSGVWQEVDSLSESQTRSVSSVWMDENGFETGGFFALAGRGVRYFLERWNEPPSWMTQGNLGLGNIYLSSIRGSSKKNVFTAGDFGLVLHFNGASWQWYPELFHYPENVLLYSVSVLNHSVFIVGERDGRGLILHGRQITF